MTHFETIILAICFGAVTGTFLGNVIILVKWKLEERKMKK